MIVRKDPSIKNKSFQKLILNNATLIIFAVGCCVIPFFTKYFLTLTNLQNLIYQSSIIGILACGSCAVLMCGYVDVSIGAVLGLSGALAAKLSSIGTSPVLIFLIPILSATVISTTSGVIISKMKLNSFIITLGMMYIIRGLILFITKEETISEVHWLIKQLGSGSIATIDILPLFFIGMSILMYFLIHQTKTGNYFIAIGGNEQTAMEWGLEVDQIKILAFMIQGIYIGLAGILHCGRMMSAHPQAGTGFEFQVIAAFVIGGGVLFSGVGNVLRTILGVFIVAIITNGLELAAVSAFIQTILRGVMVIIAVGASTIFKKPSYK